MCLKYKSALGCEVPQCGETSEYKECASPCPKTCNRKQKIFMTVLLVLVWDCAVPIEFMDHVCSTGVQLVIKSILIFSLVKFYRNTPQISGTPMKHTWSELTLSKLTYWEAILYNNDLNEYLLKCWLLNYLKNCVFRCKS